MNILEVKGDKHNGYVGQRIGRKSIP